MGRFMTRKFLWLYLFCVLGCSCFHTAYAQDTKKANSSFKAQVVDAVSGESLPMARIEVEELDLILLSDADGKFSIRRLQPGYRYKLRISYVGYQPHETSFLYKEHKEYVFRLKPSTFALKGVEVQGKRTLRESGSTKIHKEALDYLQPTGLQDAMLLTPGGLIRNPGLRNVQQIQMRETRTSANSALGTSIVMDGAPISNDTNLQGMGNHNQKLEERSTMNAGIDLRQISLDHIESIEIVQGIPSVQYGNLTSGVILLRTKIGRTPWDIRMQADPYTKLLSVGKGRNFQGGHNIYAGFDYTRSLGSVINPISSYDRLTGLMKYAHTGRGEWTPRTSVSLSYTGTLDHQKFDPEVMTSKEIYRNDFHRISLNGNFSISPRNTWLEQIEGTLALSYTHDKIHQERYISPQSTLVQPLRKETGEGEGAYLPPIYFSIFETDGRPMALFSQLRSTHRFDLKHWGGTLLMGAELRAEKNYGLGTLYDPTLPPNPGSPLSSRPIAYRDIPAEVPLALFAEQTLHGIWGKWKGNLRAGLRMTQELGLLGKGYKLSRHPLWEPRIQLSITPPSVQIAGSELQSTFFAGYGRHMKMPTLAYLYPEPAYLDLVEANYYHEKPENRLLWVRTYKIIRTNPAVRPNAENKWELGCNVRWLGAELNLSAFRHITTEGFENRVHMAYTPFNRYTYTGVVGDAKPSLSQFYKEQIHTTSSYSTPDNSVKVVKRGLEYVLRLPRIEALQTGITLQGAWYRTLYGNSLPMAYRPIVVIGGRKYPYVGFYYGRHDRDTERFHTLVRTDTHIPSLKMIFSCHMQMIWFTARQDMHYSGMPEYWVDEYGKRHDGKDLDLKDPLQKQLYTPVPDYVFDRWKEPMSASLNVKMTKEIGKNIKVSLFVNNLLTYDPVYESNLKTKHQAWRTPFFGSELRLKL